MNHFISFRWCQILDDDIYEPINVQSYKKKQEKEKEEPRELAVVSFQGLGEKYEKLFYDEATYGRLREREGRRGERVQEGEGAWSGRVGGRRHWRGRSRERGHTVTSPLVSPGDYGEVWRGRSPGPDDDHSDDHHDQRGRREERREDGGVLTWRGRSPGPWGGQPEWGGRVSGQGELRGERGQWRGRSPGLGDITTTGETWV